MKTEWGAAKKSTDRVAGLVMTGKATQNYDSDQSEFDVFPVPFDEMSAKKTLRK